MKRTFTHSIWFLLFLLPGLPAFPQGTWNLVGFPSQNALRRIFFTDSLYGWAAGENGTIIHTTDGGSTWATQTSTSQDEITDVFFLNRNLGWASAVSYSTTPPGTQLLATTNGGQSWSPLGPRFENLFIRSVLFLDPLHGWLGGTPHALLRTSDGGTSWQEPYIVPSPLSDYPILRIKFLNPATGYACGGIHDVAGVIWRTSDGGDSWTAIDPVFAPADEVYDLHILDADNVIGAGGDPDFEFGVGMVYSGDNTMDFVYRESGFRGYAINIDFRNSTEAWSSLGNQRNLIYSLDAGNTWTEVPAPDSAYITSMSFPDPAHGYACGTRGEILRYTPLLLGIPKPIISDQVDEFGITKIYPVPVRDQAVIKVHVPKHSANITVRVKLYDITGQEIGSFDNKSMGPGDHELTFNASGLRNGLYYCKVSDSNSKGSAQRFIVEH